MECYEAINILRIFNHISILDMLTFVSLHSPGQSISVHDLPKPSPPCSQSRFIGPELDIQSQR